MSQNYQATGEPLRSAIGTFLEKWTDPYLNCEGPWTAFTCQEIDALASLLRATANDEAADRILCAHAQGDDEGDSHYDLKGCRSCS